MRAKKTAAAAGREEYIIPEKRTCRICEYGVWDCQAEDMTCSNPNSAHFAAWRDMNDTCRQWKERNQEE